MYFCKFRIYNNDSDSVSYSDSNSDSDSDNDRHCNSNCNGSSDSDSNSNSNSNMNKIIMCLNIYFYEKSCNCLQIFNHKICGMYRVPIFNFSII